MRLPALAALFLVTAMPLSAAEPCVSGTPVGQRPGPYSFLVSTGPERGQPTCYICETADRPAIVIFARTLSEPLGKLASICDDAVNANKTAEMRSWITFLGERPDLDAQVILWGKKHALRSVPLGIFDDPVGPPAYKLARDADVTVLLFVKQKVVANYAFREGELTDKIIADIEKSIPTLLEKK